jgi:hypothetical protein
VPIRSLISYRIDSWKKTSNVCYVRFDNSRGANDMGIKLVEDWKRSYRWASVQLAAAVAIIAGILTANPGLLLGLIGYLPEGSWRTVASVGVSVTVFVLPTLTRLLHKEPCPEGEKPNAGAK